MRRWGALVLGLGLSVGADAHGGVRVFALGPFDIVAGETMVIEAQQVVMSSDCRQDQAQLEPSLAGVQYRWDVDIDGRYDVLFSTSPEMVFSAIGRDGPVDVPVRLEAACWYLHNGSLRMDSDDTDFVVRVANAPPTLTGVQAVGYPQDALPIGVPILFAAEATDPEPADSVAVTWAWADGPRTAGLTTGREFMTAGRIEVAVTADDGTDTAFGTWTFNVIDPPPVITAIEYEDPSLEGSPVALKVRASDPAGGLSSWWEVPGGVILSGEPTLGLPTGEWGEQVEWLPPGDGVWPLRVTVSDGVNLVSEDRWIVVQNLPPQLKALSTSVDVIWEGEPVDLYAEVGDPGGDPVSVAWEIDGTFTGFGPPGEQRLTWTWSDDAAPARIGVTLRDDAGAAVQSSAELVVNNRPPNLVVFEVPSTVDEGAEIVARAEALDVAADPLRYTWTVLSPWTLDEEVLEGPEVSLALPEGEHTLRLQVDDGDGGVIERDAVVWVNNAPPVVELEAPTSAFEGSLVTLAATAYDPGGDPLTIEWYFGDGDTADGAFVQHAWDDDGVYHCDVVVHDSQGGVRTESFVVTVVNSAPRVSVGEVPQAEEGREVLLTASAEDVPADLPQISWWVDGALQATGPTWRARFRDDATIVVTVRADDNDGGADEATFELVVANVPPVVVIDGPSGALPGSQGTWTAQVTDPGADTHTYQWYFGDGTTESGGPTISHAYARNGQYAVAVRVEDDDGGSDIDEVQIAVRTIGPSIVNFELPDPLPEGEDAPLGCLAEDSGATGSLRYSWDFGDQTNGAGSATRHVWPDNGSWYVTCTVVDGAGVTATVGGLVQTTNVAPTLAGSPPRIVVAGDVATFAPVVTDPGAADRHSWVVYGPPGAMIDARGVFSWATTDRDVGRWDIRVEVRDDDGATGSLDFVLQVSARDFDGDGMPDPWETEHALNPADATDAALDGDLDGRSNLDEYLVGSDPNRDDRPAAPSLLWPVGGVEIDSFAAELVVGPPTGATGPLLYDLRVYSDPGLSTLVDAYDLLQGDAGGLRQPTAPLEENHVYWWHARASDAWAAGRWAVVESFQVNTTEEPPGTPVLQGPADLLTVAVLSPELSWSAVRDPDGDEVTYRVHLVVGNPGTTTSIATVEGAGPIVTWQTTPLSDGDEVCWWVEAVDEAGLTGEPSLSWCFVVDTSNMPPAAPEILSPAEGATLDSFTTVIDVRNAVDPEGRETRHVFQLSADPSFAGATSVWVETDLDGVTSWPVGPLQEDTWYHARAAASDGAAQGPWAEVSFFINAQNDPPSAPVAVLPDPGDLLRAGDMLVVANPIDPEGFPVSVDMVVLSGDTVVAQVVALKPGEDRTSWDPGPLVPGSYTWQARGVDVAQLAGPWSPLRSFIVPSPEPGPNSRPVVPDPTVQMDPLLTGCGCDSAGGRGWLLLLALPWLRRRR